MILASEIINRVRHSIDDNRKDRWTDTFLLLLLNDALKDLAFTTDIFDNYSYVEIQENVATYNFNNVAVAIKRIEYDNIPLDRYTHKQMDALYGPNWQEDTGDTFKGVIYDLTSNVKFLLYPVPSFGDYTSAVESNSDYGIVTSINTLDELELSSEMGDISTDGEVRYLKVFYSAYPTKLLTTSDTLDEYVSDSHIDAITSYVSSKALTAASNDMNTRQLGYNERKMYEKYKNNIDNKMGVDTRNIYDTGYNPYG